METLLTKTSNAGWPKVGLQEYQLVIQPDDKLGSTLLHEKQNFFEQYRQNIALKTKPHIVIATFTATEEMEETIVRYMQRILIQQKAFVIALNNYSGIPPHTVYLRVQNPQAIVQITNRLSAVDNYISSCFCPPVTFIKNPHISIAKNLNETLYQKAMMDYSQKTFHETFMANDLVLVKKSHEYDTEKTVNVFRLQPSSNTLYN